MKKLVIIPTYNEKENIEKIISAVFGLQQDFHILVVDDSSPDGTADIVKELREKYPLQLHLTVRKIKDGLGKAYIHGFQWAIHNEYDFIFEMDADFSHNPKDLIKLYERHLAPAIGAIAGRCVWQQRRDDPLGRRQWFSG
ncbi:MAG: glycosyltransferase, partial [Chryseobacterium sp.]|nr:glycosyltransferase [Chryseobacterium sp.]